MCSTIDDDMDLYMLDPHFETKNKLTLQEFAEYCHKFYRNNWMRGAGGAMACLQDNILFVTPEHVHKDRMRPEDIFTIDVERKVLVQVPENIEASYALPLFSAIMLDSGCSSVIHTHSPAARAVSKLHPCCFEISHREFLKDVSLTEEGDMLSDSEILRIPIIDNKPNEVELVDDIRKVVNGKEYYTAVLVRDHGLFVWGKTWEETEFKAECMEKLFYKAVRLYRDCEPWIIDENDNSPRCDYLLSDFVTMDI